MNKRNKPEDIRYQKTRESIQNALIYLLNHEEPEHVSITSICHQARIARSTFYDHYENISECLTEIGEELLEQLEEQLKKEEKISRNRFMELYFHLVRDNRERFYILCNTSPDSAFSRRMKQLFFQYVSREKDNSYWVYYRIYGVLGITKRWIDDQCSTPVEELIQAMFG